MPFYIRKAFSFGRFFKINLSKSGLGWSFGTTGARIGQKPNGRGYVHAGRGGLYYRESLGSTANGTSSGQGGVLVIMGMVLCLSLVIPYIMDSFTTPQYNSWGEEIITGERGGRYVIRNGRKVYGQVAVSNNELVNESQVRVKSSGNSTSQKEMDELREYFAKKKKDEDEKYEARRKELNHEYGMKASQEFINNQSEAYRLYNKRLLEPPKPSP